MFRRLGQTSKPTVIRTEFSHIAAAAMGHHRFERTPMTTSARSNAASTAPQGKALFACPQRCARDHRGTHVRHAESYGAEPLVASPAHKREDAGYDERAGPLQPNRDEVEHASGRSADVHVIARLAAVVSEAVVGVVVVGAGRVSHLGELDVRVANLPASDADASHARDEVIQRALTK